MPKAPGLNFRQAVALIKTVCDVAGSRDLINDTQRDLSRAGILRAVKEHDNDTLFDWLMHCFSYQGVSDAVVTSFINAHGNATAEQIAQDLSAGPQCIKLGSWWLFNGCGYRKAKTTCALPRLTRHCPLPRLDLRNGSLNQTAYGLYLFMRDVADNDLVTYFDRRLAWAEVNDTSGVDALIDPLAHVHGLSFKVLNMTLATLLLAGDPKRDAWKTTGAQMVAVDSLVHNWLHRTGILRGLDSDHAYGAGCQREGSCADILRAVANEIDARAFNPGFPKCFPRFVQHAIWSFCSADGLAQCNGNRIDDRNRCHLSDCILFDDCARLKLGRVTATTTAA